MRTPDLPDPIAAYFAADLQDGQAVARCFTGDGRVLDEGEVHQGPAAIAAWKIATSKKYTYTARPHTLEQQGRHFIVTSTVSGDFPGSPVDLRYTFALERGKVASLEIGA